ncbi:protein disulfide isomerase-like 5-4 [Ipomoea triloba]|uniref:protein disulfide isomerase-like 5-4 n=1 Tax=Ipomoea triloba TaxID=35885 RepID=UPI00125E52A4|nr:protein disulfide isomerase-like 5-4 [Ipomoea triloba]
MFSTGKLKSVDFYRKIPRDLTEASLSGAGLSIIAALCMVFLFGMELNNYMTVSTTTSIVVDKSSDGDFLRIDFNLSFPALSCEFASVDVIDVLGTNRLNITKTVRKYSIDSNLRHTGSEFQSGAIVAVKHDEEVDEEYGEGAISLNGRTFDRIVHEYPILVVNFYAPWCYWSNRLKPSWEKAAKIIKERYDPEMDGRILLGKVDCTEEVDLCKRNHIQGYPSIRIFRKGSDLKEDHGHHEHESYYGDRDTESLVKTMEELVAPISLESQRVASDGKSNKLANGTKRPAPATGGCRIEGFVRVKKVPGNLVISAHSGAHSFDGSQMNMSHVISRFSFGKMISSREMSDVKRLLPYLGQNYDKLSGKTYITNPKDSSENVTIEHYIQVVKTEVMTRSYKLVEEYEYTAHSSLVHSFDLPVAKFHVVPSAMQVIIKENAKSFSHFLTNVCAIIGGVFTVAGILDSILHNTMRLMRKVELGKNF